MVLLCMMNVLVGFFGWGSKITECIQLFGFCSGGTIMFWKGYGCCNIAHAKRTLHIKYPNNISNAMLEGVPKRKIIIW